jgi:AraC-like DNA-binding protein
VRLTRSEDFANLRCSIAYSLCHGATTHSALTLTAIAEQCGFTSLATFSRAFRRSEKAAPSEYLHGPLNKRSNNSAV